MATNDTEGGTEERKEVSMMTDVVCPGCQSDNYMEIPGLSDSEYRVLCLDCGQTFSIRWVVVWEPKEKGGDNDGEPCTED